MDIQKIIEGHDLILTEAAVVEPLRRDPDIRLDEHLVHAALIYEPVGRTALSRLYDSYIEVARQGRIPIAVCAPTWRVNRERLDRAGMTRDVNADAVVFMHRVRDRWDDWGAGHILIGGLLGCKHDCYKPEEGISTEASRIFHAWQINRLADAGADFLIGATMPAVPEAMGMAMAMAQSGKPYFISFVIGRDGAVLDGHSLADAMAAVDAACTRPPLGYMVNCSYPSFLHARRQPTSVLSRLVGFQANASSLDHDQLEGAEELQADDLCDWGRRMVALNRDYGINVLGGCCGTGPAHLQYIVDHIHQPKTSSQRKTS